MEERFKFRLFDKKTGEMIYNFTIDSEGSFADVYGDKKLFVLQQCTGLHDKNGKLIYEGDLLRYPAKDQYEERFYTFFEVFWHDNDCCDNHIGWQMNRLHPMGGLTDCSRSYKFIPRITEQMEIIGNIYENKKLLEEQNEKKDRTNS